MTYKVILDQPDNVDSQFLVETSRVHFDDGVSLNSLDFTYSWDNLVMKAYSAGPISNIHIAGFNLQTLTGDATCSSSKNWQTEKINSNGHPICVRMRMELLGVTAGQYYNLLSKEYYNDIYFKYLMKDLRKELYKDLSDFGIHVIGSSCSERFNCLAFSINDANQYFEFPLKSK